MNQASVTNLVSKLRVKVPEKPRRLRNIKGPEGRLDAIRKTLTGLIRYERIEVNFNRGDETRQYVERLISEAIRHGDTHKPTMEMADFWLLDKELVHKLFKVLVPRFENCPTAYTKMYRAPKPEYGRHLEKAVLELRGNPYPSLVNRQAHNKHLIQNVLLDAAKYEYRQSKYAEMAEKIGKSEENSQIETKSNQNTESKVDN